MADNEINPFADAAATVMHSDAQNTAVQIRNNVQFAVGQNPDQAAQYQHLAKYVGVPVETVHAQPEAIKQQAALQSMDADKLTSDYPTIAKYLTDPQNAAKSHDDIAPLAAVESAVKALPAPAAKPPSFGDTLLGLPMDFAKGLGGSFNKAAGSVNLLLGAFPTLYDKAASLITGKDTTAASDYWFKNMVDPRINAQSAFETRPDAPFISKAVSTVGNLVGMLSQIGLTGGVGEAAPAAASVPEMLGNTAAHGAKSMAFPAITDSVDTGRKVYQETGDAGAALRAAQMQYATTTAAGVVPLSAPGGIATRLAGGFASGVASGEASRTAMNMVLPTSMQQPFDLEGTMLSGLAGSMLGGVMGPRGEPSYHGAIRQAYADAAKADAAEQGMQSLQALGELATASKTRARDPEGFKDLVRSMTEDGNLQDVYVDANKFAEVLNQSGVDIKKLAETMPDVAAQFHEAVQTNGDIRIPVEDYATHIAGGPVDAALLPHLKTDPDGFTYQQGQEFYQSQQADMKAQAEKILADKQTDDAFRTDAQGVHDQVLDQLNAAARFRPDVNNAYAALARDFYVTQAGRAGMKPSELFEKYPLKVTSEALTGGLNQLPARSFARQLEAEHPGAKIDLSGGDGRPMVLSRIIVPEGERNAGTGTEIMSKIIAEADRNGTTVALSPAADFGGNKKRLVEFYKRFGFVENKGRNKDFEISESMYRTPKTLAQGDLEQGARGSFNPETNTIGLLKDADLSTFLHESGHFFLETMHDMARGADAPAGIREDFDTLLKSFGEKGETPEQRLADWSGKTLDEKRDAHEQFARGFEAYLMEGKAPTLELQGLFARFRSWLVNIYKSLANLNVELSPEVRGVMDRMLASEEAIKQAEQVRNYLPLDKAPEGTTPEQFAAYQALGKEATEQAMADMTARSLRDMQWASRAKNRTIKALQRQAKAEREAIRREVTPEVMRQPIYQAWQFLVMRGHESTQAFPEAKEKADPSRVDPARDSLFTAIAKHGGLDRDEARKMWGVDHRDMPDSGVFGKPILRKEGGKSIDEMTSLLVHDHYLSDHDHNELEDKFDRERGGDQQFSWQYEYRGGGPQPEAIDRTFTYHGKLNTDDLRYMYGTGKDAAWRKLSERGMTSDKTGLDPDIVAETFGFTSGRELVDELANAISPHQAIESLTDQRMLERHGDLVDPVSIERAAEAAIHNEARARFMATGLKMLSKSPIPARQLAKAAEEAANASVAVKRVRELRPAQYSAAEARANKEALDKAAKDPAGAVQAQRAALLNNRLFKAATDAVAEVQKGVDYLKKFDKPAVREKIALDYRDQIDNLLDRFDLRKSTTNAALDMRESLVNFVEHMAAQGMEPQVPEKLLNEAMKQHYKDMTVEEFRGLVDAVKSIDTMGRKAQLVADGTEMREIAALADEAAAAMAELPQRAPESNRGLSKIDAALLKLKSSGRSMQAALLKMEQMMDWLDNRNPNGVLNRVVFRRIADAGVHEADMQAKIKSEIDKLLESNLADVTKDGNKVYVAEGLIDGLTGKPQRFTKKEMLALAGNMGNDSNMSKLLAGEKWSETAVWKFLHENMTKADWDFVAGLGKTLETLWPEKLAMSRRLGNTNPEKIAPRPFDTPHGRYDGWYWPMVYDPARAQDVAERGAKAGDSLFENIYTRANTDTGRMNTRNENYARPVLLSLDVIPRVIKDEIHDIAYREAIMDADKFLSHPTVRESIQSALSPEHYAQLRPWLQSIANDRKVDMQALKWFDQLAHGARTRATIVGLGYRLSTMLVHGSSAALESVAEVGPVWFAKGLADFANPRQWAANKDFIFERSGEMRNRANEVDRDIREHLREIDLRLMDTTSSAVSRGADLMKAHAYEGIAMLDMASALPTWMAAYHKGMAPESEGGKGLSEQDAIYFADKTVRNAHGGTGVKDMAAVQRGPEFFKLFTMFYTFWNHNVNRLMDTARMMKDGDTWRDSEKAGTAIMRFLIYTLGIQAMHGMLHPKQDDEGDTNWLTWAAKEFTSAAFAGIPILRDLSAHYITGKDYSATPAAAMVDAVGQSGVDALNALTGKEANDKWLKHTINTTGYVFGLPTGQFSSAGQFLWDVAGGKQDPQDLADWWRGILHGNMTKH